MNTSMPLTPVNFDDKCLQKFVVPIYQRLFVWERDQIWQLLSDLYNAYTDKDSCKHDYDIGVITIHETDTNKWEIVDGQQRLTFITLLGIEFLKREDCHGQDNCWKSFIYVNEEMPRITYVGRDNDQCEIKNRPVPYTNPYFAGFSACFKEFIEKNNVRVEEFSKYCYEHIAFLVNELPVNYTPFDLNLYFEKMNSTGRQLTPIEIVKGIFFAKHANIWNKCMYFGERFVDKNDNTENGTDPQSQFSIEDLFSKGPEDLSLNSLNESKSETVVFDRLVMKPEVFLLHVLKLTYENKDISFDASRLISTFKQNLGNKDIGDFIKAMKDYRLWIDKNIIYLKSDGNQYKYCFRDDNQNCDEDTNDEENLRNLECQFQAMLYVASSDSQEWVLDAYQKSKESGCQDNGHNIKSVLERYISEKYRLPDDANSLQYPMIERFWFWKLDYLLWELHENTYRYCKGEWVRRENDSQSSLDIMKMLDLSPDEHRAIHEYTFRRNRSIEHFLPQNGADGAWVEDCNGVCLLHSFGNLCMISNNFNSSQSDDSINTKCGRIDDQVKENRLESIKMLLMRKLAGIEKSWTPEHAVKHGRDMLKILGFKDEAIKNGKKICVQVM